MEAEFTEFRVERGSFPAARERETFAAVDTTCPERGGQFLPELHPFLGSDTEPDTLFFVESWTLGIPRAVENARQRQLGQIEREQQSNVFQRFSNLGSQFYMEEALRTAEQFRSSHTAVSSSRPHEWIPAHTYSAAGQKSGDWPESESSNQDVTLPMTHKRACKILGVSATSTHGEIKTAYRRMVNRWHPDRLEHGAEEDRQIANLRMTAINEAYRLMCSGLPKSA